MKKETWRVLASFFLALLLLGNFLEVRAANVSFSFQLSETNPGKVNCYRKGENAPVSYIIFDSIEGSQDLSLMVWISDGSGKSLTKKLEVTPDDIHKKIALPYYQQYGTIQGQYLRLNIKVIGKYAQVKGVWIQ